MALHAGELDAASAPAQVVPLQQTLVNCAAPGFGLPMSTSAASPSPGKSETLAPGIRRILAPNPSPMTYWGTNTFLLGEGEVTVIDPGPALPAHQSAILAGLAPGERIARVLVTHAHRDHSPLARPLAEATGAAVFGYGTAFAGRTALMADLAARGVTGGGEGVDTDFAPDEIVGDGDTIDIGNGATLKAIWTPGHFAGHLCFALDDIVFTGDHVMGWASTFISPPDGDVSAFLASCHKLAALGARRLFPAHGPEVDDPAGRLSWLVAHRREREAQILDGLAAGPATVRALAEAIYADLDPALLPAAERNVFAHLVDLTAQGRLEARPELATDARFERRG